MPTVNSEATDIVTQAMKLESLVNKNRAEAAISALFYLDEAIAMMDVSEPQGCEARDLLENARCVFTNGNSERDDQQFLSLMDATYRSGAPFNRDWKNA